MKRALSKHSSLFITVQLIVAVIIMLLVGNQTQGYQALLLNLSLYLFLFIIPVFIFIRYRLHEEPLSYLRLKEKPLLSIAKGLLIGLFISLIFLVTNRFRFSFVADRDGFLMLTGAVMAGILEEIPFRGFYLKAFSQKWGFWPANILTAALFALLHFQKILSQGIIQLPMLFIIGLWLGYIYHKTKSLWPPILTHVVFNILTIIF